MKAGDAIHTHEVPSSLAQAVRCFRSAFFDSSLQQMIYDSEASLPDGPALPIVAYCVALFIPDHLPFIVHNKVMMQHWVMECTAEKRERTILTARSRTIYLLILPGHMARKQSPQYILTL